MARNHERRSQSFLGIGDYRVLSLRAFTSQAVFGSSFYRLALFMHL